MEHLTDAMRAATAAPPPAAIDLDQLIADERRNSRRRQWGAGIGAVLAVLLIAGAIAYLPGLARSIGEGGLRAGDQGGGTTTKTEPGKNVGATAAQQAEAERLSQVLAQALVAVVGPDHGWTVDGLIWEAQTGLTGDDMPTPGYSGGANRVDGSAIDKIYLMVRRAPMPSETTCAKDTAPDTACTVDVRADGSQLWQATRIGGGQVTRHVEVYRPGGVHVLVGDTVVGRSDPALTMAQLIAIADTPGLAPTIV